jgi:hypothetical protein
MSLERGRCAEGKLRGMASVATVHLVRPVLANPEYQYMLFDLPEDEMPSFERFDGIPRGSAWTPMPVYVPEPKLEEPEVWHLGVSLFVMSRQTVDILEPFVAHSAELLPLTTSDGRADLVAVNVVRTFDCLSPNAVKREPLGVVPEFLAHRLPETGLFKIPQLSMTLVFCVERDDDDDSFRRRAEDLGLTGVGFVRVWSSETGPEEMDLLFPPML